MPYFRDQKGFAGHVLGGWQLNSQFSLQSGSPFTPLNGSDLAIALASISALVGNAIRPNLNTTLDLSSMSVEELVAAGGLAMQREKGPARYVFVYKTRLKNNGTTAITAIDWDHVFFERGTEQEIGRQQFTSDEQIGPGKSKELTVIVGSSPTQTVSVTSLNLGEHERLSEKVVLMRVKYADGIVWVNPENF